MADAFRVQLQNEHMKVVPFGDRLGMLVDIDYTNRKNITRARLIKNAVWNSQTQVLLQSIIILVES